MQPSLINAIISLVPNAEVVVRDTGTEAIIEWIRPSEAEAPVTREEIDTELERLIAKVPFDNCKSEAKSLISKTDWAVLSDVGILNVSEYIVYRLELRALILTPIAEPVWPIEPQPVWV